MKSFLFLLIVQIAVACTTSGPATGQDLRQPPSDTGRTGLLWLDAGLGFCSVGVAAGLGLNAAYGNAIYSIRGVYTGQNKGLFEEPNLHESAWDIALLYGRTLSNGAAMVSLSGGVSYVSGVDRGPLLYSAWFFGNVYDQLHYSTIGLAGEARALVMLGVVGFGVYAFGDLNPKNSFGGIMVSVGIGKLK